MSDSRGWREVREELGGPLSLLIVSVIVFLVLAIIDCSRGTVVNQAEADRLRMKEVEEISNYLLAHFKEFDTDNNGSISEGELEKAIAADRYDNRILLQAKKEIDAIGHEVDKHTFISSYGMGQSSTSTTIDSAISKRDLETYPERARK